MREARLVDWRYGLLAVLSMTGLYWLSSRPDLGTTDSEVEQLLSSLAHVPLFAGLAACGLKAACPTDQVTWWKCAAVLAVTAAWAVMDEWHQAAVPGRTASVSDLFLDFSGIAAALVWFRVKAAHRMRAAQPHGL